MHNYKIRLTEDDTATYLRSLKIQSLWTWHEHCSFNRQEHIILLHEQNYTCQLTVKI